MIKSCITVMLFHQVQHVFADLNIDRYRISASEAGQKVFCSTCVICLSGVKKTPLSVVHCSCVMKMTRKNNINKSGIQTHQCSFKRNAYLPKAALEFYDNYPQINVRVTVYLILLN